MKNTEECGLRIYRAMLAEGDLEMKEGISKDRVKLDEPNKVDTPPEIPFEPMEDLPTTSDAALDHDDKDPEPDPMDKYNDEDVNAEMFGDFDDHDDEVAMDAEDVVNETGMSDSMAITSCMKAMADNLQTFWG